MGGAKPAGLAGQLGAIRSGYTADLTLLDLANPSFVPLNSAARQVVYRESGAAVRTVLVDGRVVVDNGRVTTIDEAALRAEIIDLMVELTRTPRKSPRATRLYEKRSSKLLAERGNIRFPFTATSGFPLSLPNLSETCSRNLCIGQQQQRAIQ